MKMVMHNRSNASTGQLSVNDTHDSSLLTITTGRLLWLYLVSCLTPMVHVVYTTLLDETASMVSGASLQVSAKRSFQVSGNIRLKPENSEKMSSMLHLSKKGSKLTIVGLTPET